MDSRPLGTSPADNSLGGVWCARLGWLNYCWRSKRVLQAFALGHVGATLVVAVGLAAAIDFGWLPLSVAGDSDVGLRHGTVAVLGSLTAAVP